MTEPTIIELKTFTDHRGWFSETMHLGRLKENFGIDFVPVQENTSMSKKNIVRGFHYQTGKFDQAKLLRVIKGSITDVLVDVRPGKTFGKIHKFFLSDRNLELLYIPKGFAHGFASLEDDTIITYKTDTYYSKPHCAGFNPLGIEWDIEEPIISERDRNALSWDEHVKANF